VIARAASIDRLATLGMSGYRPWETAGAARRTTRRRTTLSLVRSRLAAAVRRAA
jgi:hypothetical protein